MTAWQPTMQGIRWICPCAAPGLPTRKRLTKIHRDRDDHDTTVENYECGLGCRWQRVNRPPAEPFWHYIGQNPRLVSSIDVEP